MRTTVSVAAGAALLACAAFAAVAQPGPPAAGPNAMPSGPRAGPPATRPRVGRDFTPGWAMMSAQERDEFHQRLAAAKTRGECRQLLDEHRQTMAERAKERGMAMRTPRRDACSALRR